MRGWEGSVKLQSLLSQSLFFRQNSHRELFSHRPDALQLLLRHSLPWVQDPPARFLVSQTGFAVRALQNNLFRWEAQLS